MYLSGSPAIARPAALETVNWTAWLKGPRGASYMGGLPGVHQALSPLAHAFAIDAP